MFVSGQNCSSIIILLGHVSLWGLDRWIPLPSSPDYHIRWIVMSIAATGWLSLLLWQPLLTRGPRRRRRFHPSDSFLHLPLHPSHSSTSTTCTVAYITRKHWSVGEAQHTPLNVGRQPWSSEREEKEKFREPQKSVWRRGRIMDKGKNK